jgi:hypothetical protein
MMETEQGCPSRHISAQLAIEFLTTIWLELLDWGAIALNSAGRFFTALFNFVMLAIAALVAALKRSGRLGRIVSVTKYSTGISGGLRQR